MSQPSSSRGLKPGADRAGLARSRRPKPLNNLAAGRRSFLPRLEALEDRAVPSAGYDFRTIDPPQAVQVSVPTLINSSGEIVGAYTDANFVLHGYLLRGGQYATIDDPNAGTAPGQGTVALGINGSGTILGAYLDANSVFHGYLLSGGRYTTLDDPNAGTAPGQGTAADAINASGVIVGHYFDANSVEHGFLLSGGRYTTLDDPNAGTAPGQGTITQGISAAGVIVGVYVDANSVHHGLLLSGGRYTTIDDPAGVLGTDATGINDHGQVTGGYTDANGLQHGFVLSGGQFTTIDDPAGVLGGAADSVNDSGKVVGVYTDANGVTHGYLATPAHGSTAAPDTFGFASTDLAPAQGTLNASGNTPAAQSNPENVPTPPAVSGTDQVVAAQRRGTAHQLFQHSLFRSAKGPAGGLTDGLADDVAGHP
jgi:probable HAF family extracellular repeat protein